MISFKNIIVTTDFSQLSLSAFDIAKDLSDKYDADIHLIYVLGKELPMFGYSENELSDEKFFEKIKLEAEEKLERTKRMLEDDGDFYGIKQNVLTGIDYEEIVSYAQKLEDPLIVIATHGRTGTIHSLLGSVAEKVVRFSKCPVFVAKLHEAPE